MVRSDIYGAPLPEGALSRCGLSTLTHRDLTWFGFAPDGGTIASAGEDGVVRVWDCSSGHLVRELCGHEGTVHAAAYFPDGERLITAGRDGHARIFRLSDGHVERDLSFAASVTGVAVSTDGARIALGLSDSASATSRVVIREQGREVGVLTAQGAGGRWYLAFAPDGRSLAALHVDGIVAEAARFWLWDCVTRRVRSEFMGGTASLYGTCRYLNEQTLLVSVWPDESGIDRMALLDAATGQVKEFLSDAWNAAGDDRGCIWLLDSGLLYERGAGRDRPWFYTPGFPGEAALFEVAPKSRLAAVQCEDRILVVSLDSAAQLPAALPRSPIDALSFSTDGKRLTALARDDTRSFCFDALTGVLSASATAPQPWDSGARRALGNACAFDLVRTAEWQPVERFSERGSSAGYELPELDSCEVFAVSPDGRLALACDDRKLIAWEVGSGRRIRTLDTSALGVPSQSGTLSSLGWATWQVSRGAAHYVVALNVFTGEQRELFGPVPTPELLSFATAASADMAVVVCGKVVMTFAGAEPHVVAGLGFVCGVAVSPDGKTIAVGDLDGRLRLCSPEGQVRRAWSGHDCYISALAFSADGKHIASGAADACVVLWSVAHS